MQVTPIFSFCPNLRFFGLSVRFARGFLFVRFFGLSVRFARGFLFAGFGLSVRFAQEVRYHAHLALAQDSLVGAVAGCLQGFEKSTGLAYLFAEQRHRALVVFVGIVAHGKFAELSLLSFHGHKN